jgi:UDP-N-acetyl-2-amino-2-deoxyglucuronate dehydrogenase
MTPVKFAVVGCGSIGRRHVSVLRQNPDASVVAVCDSHAGRLQAQVDGHPATRAFADYETMLREVEADVIDICTPHALHAPMAMQAARAGRHVLVEKPMALTVRDAQQMIDTANSHGVQLMVVKQNRYNVPVRLAKEALDGGWLGPVHMVLCNVLWNRHAPYYTDSDWRGQRDKEGGALFTQVSHFLDLLIWWFGGVERAQAVVDTRKHAISVEDCGAASVQFASGVVGSVTWTTCVYGQNLEGSITIIGDKGTIKIGGQYLNTIEHWDVEGHPLPPDVVFNDRPNEYGKYQGTSSNHAEVFADVIAHLQRGGGAIVDGDEGIRSIEAIVSIYTAAAGRQWPTRIAPTP